MSTENQTSDQPASSQESAGRDHPAEKMDNPRNYFADKLAAERGESKDQPQGGEGDDDEQTSGRLNEADDGADDEEEDSGNQSNDDADDQDDEDADDDNDEGDADSDGEGDDDDDQGDDEPESGTLQVDDQEYSADDVKALVKKSQDLEKGYRQSTQEMAERRTEYDKNGQELEAVAAFFKNLTTANVSSLEAMDLSAMSPEQVQAWQQQYNSTKAGSAQVQGQIDKLLGEIEKAREKMKDHAAAESLQVLKGTETRWNDAFYAKVREFAVESKRYTAKEFGDITDWRTIEGIIAVMDKNQVVRATKQTGKDAKNAKTVDKPARKRRRQNKKVRRDSAGKFATAKTKVLESGNARKDGSFREMLQAKLANER